MFLVSQQSVNDGRKLLFFVQGFQKQAVRIILKRIKLASTWTKYVNPDGKLSYFTLICEYLYEAVFSLPSHQDNYSK